MLEIESTCRELVAVCPQSAICGASIKYSMQSTGCKVLVAECLQSSYRVLVSEYLTRRVTADYCRVSAVYWLQTPCRALVAKYQLKGACRVLTEY